MCLNKKSNGGKFFSPTFEPHYGSRWGRAKTTAIMACQGREEEEEEETDALARVRTMRFDTLMC